MSSPSKVTIEIVEHFPTVIPFKDRQGNIIDERIDPNSGTFRAYWVEMKMDLLGCRYFFKSPTHTHIMLPSTRAYDKDTKMMVSFPAISFMDNDLNTSLFNELKRAFTVYAASKYMVFDPKRVTRQQRFRKQEGSRKPQRSAEIKQSGTFSKYKEWKDLNEKKF